MNKWILVTGASSGIGKATAIRLLKDGYSLVLTSRREEEIKRIFSAFDESLYRIIPWDLSDLDKIEDYVHLVNQTVGPIRGFIHCAGIQITVPIGMVKSNKILDIFKINTFAPIMLTSLFSKNGFYDPNGSSFVLISSIRAHEGGVGLSLYAATKGAIEGFLPAASAELASKKIRINVVIPGMVKTEMVEDFFEKISKEQVDQIKSTYPLGIGNPEDVSNLIAFLISDESKWIDGQKFIIDGGHLSRKV